MSPKTIFLLLFVLLANSLPAQLDFSFLLSKKAILTEHTPAFSDFRMNGEISCLSGDCKGGKGVLKIANAYRSNIFVIANFDKKQIEGDASILTINLIHDDSDFERYKQIMKLKNEIESAAAKIGEKEIYDFYKTFSSEANEAYFGNFSENKLTDGLYTFNGNVEDLNMRIKKLPLKHLYHITPGNEIKAFPLEKDFKFSYRGEFKPEYGERTPAFTLNREDDNIEVVPSWGHDIIVKAHPIPHYFEVTYYDKNGLIINEVLSHQNLYGTIGWQKEFLPGAEQPLSTIETKYNTVLRKKAVENVGIVSSSGHPYRDGIFYGWLKDDKPAHYGIFMNDHFLYEGFFDENGEFDGYGFFTLRKPVSSSSGSYKLIQNHKFIEGYLAGFFEHGKFSYGAAAWVNKQGDETNGISPNKIRIKYGKIINKTPEEALNFERNSLYGSQYKHHALEGEGSEFSILTLPTKDLLNQQFSIGLLSSGNYENGLLEGEGIQHKGIGGGYWKGIFANGEITQESKNAQLKEEYTAYKELEKNTLENAPYPPASIIKKGGSFYYVNELKTNQSISACRLPLEKDDPMRGQERLMGSNIYYNPAPILWANPYFGQLFHQTTIWLKEEKPELTNHSLCERCNGFGEWTERVAKQEMGTESTTRWTRTYEGVYYDTYQNVTTTKAVPITTYVNKKVTCPVCDGEGHHE